MKKQHSDCTQTEQNHNLTFFLTHFLLFAPNAPSLIKGAYNNTIIRLKSLDLAK